MSETVRTNGYLARQEIERIKSTLPEDRLEQFGFKVYSQGDEDGIIEEIFNRLRIKKGTFLEIGVENGLECNTMYLLHKGWKGYWIEGNADQIPNFQKFEGLCKKGQLTIGISHVTKENINPIINDFDIKDNLDFLSIDIDGMDIHILDALEIRPKVICIEYNAKWPAYVERVPVYDPDYCWKGDDYMGASLYSIIKVATRKGYTLVGTNITGANAFFVRSDLTNVFPYHTIDKLYNPPRYWLIFDHFWHIGHPAGFGEYED